MNLPRPTQSWLLAAVWLPLSLLGADSSSVTNDAALTNAPSQGRGERERQSNAPSRPASSATSSADFSAFRIIAEKNIFDPNRAPRRTEPVRTRPRSVDSFALVGIMSYEKGTFAFFDGTRSEFKKAVKESDAIAGFRIASIDAQTVKLASDGKQFELRVGHQLRREEDGEWEPSSRTESYASAPTASAGQRSRQGSTPASSGASPSAAEPDNEILKRLMQRREQE
jgi:hypothetical protein